MTSSTPPATPDRSHPTWIGHWLLAVAALHTIAAWMMFRQPFADIARQGVFNSLGHDPAKGVAVWFLLFGGLLALLGMAVTALERQGARATLRAIAWWMLALCVFGVVLMPASGFWLAFPPVLALLFRK